MMMAVHRGATVSAGRTESPWTVEPQITFFDELFSARASGHRAQPLSDFTLGPERSSSWHTHYQVAGYPNAPTWISLRANLGSQKRHSKLYARPCATRAAGV